MQSPHGMKTPTEIAKSVLAVILFLLLLGVLFRVSGFG